MCDFDKRRSQAHYKAAQCCALLRTAVSSTQYSLSQHGCGEATLSLRTAAAHASPRAADRPPTHSWPF
eukprot:6191387-Pleurochrysis_carterae.AAC.2